MALSRFGLEKFFGGEQRAAAGPPDAARRSWHALAGRRAGAPTGSSPSGTEPRLAPSLAGAQAGSGRDGANDRPRGTVVHDVFISSAADDKPVAEAVCAALERRGIRCWMAPRDVRPGSRYEDSIAEALDAAPVVVLVVSSRSIVSPDVIREARRAANRNSELIYFRIEDVELPGELQFLPPYPHPPHPIDAFAPPLERHLSELASYIEGVLRIRDSLVPRPGAASAPSAPSTSAPAPTHPPPSVGAPRPMVAPPTIAETIGGLFSAAKSRLRGLLRPGPEGRGDTAQQPTDSASRVPEDRADRARTRTWAVGTLATDPVHFSVTSPPAVRPGASFVINVWAYLAHQRSDMLQRAQDALGGVRPGVQSKGPTRVARGSVLAVRLRIAEWFPEDLEDTLLWEGEISNATFGVTAPSDAHPGAKPGIVRIYAQGLEIARIHFTTEVDLAAAQRPDVAVTGEPHRSAFASYASEDRDAVLARLQGILKVAPGLDVFIDVAKIRSGQDWQAVLSREIVARDVFYLFWSDHARKSKMVDWEWRYALGARGLDFIDPVPLAPPDKVPPPPELAAKHFNDWMLAYMRAASTPRGAGSGQT